MASLIETRLLPRRARCFARNFYVDHLHRPVLAPGRADLHSLAALPSIRAIPDRSVFYVARPIRSIRFASRSLTFAPQVL